MLRGYRSIVVALAGLALSGATPPKKETVTQQATSQPSPTTAPLADYTPYPNRYADSCYGDKGHDTADLCAQWRAAVAADKNADTAYWSNWIAGAGAMLSFVSIILVVIALGQTRKANRISKREYGAGRLDAKNASKLTEDSLREARQTNARQLRPYLNFMGEKSNDPKFERGAPIPYAFKNFGQTPAENVGIEFGWDIVQRPVGDIDIIHFTERERYGLIAPGQLVEDFFNNAFTPDDIARVAKGHVLIVRVRLHYTWGDASDCCDVTWCLSNDGARPWTFGQLTRTERNRQA